MELVTGFAGTAHIDPVDTAHVHAASFGPGAYLLDTQNKLAAELETANKLVIDKGDLMIQGHHFTVIEPEDVALQSGVSGQKRNALVCAKYNKDANTGVETGSWVVKYGDSTTGTPTDPTVTTGDILDGGALVHEEPVYRIEYDGITPSYPILLLDEFTNNASFRDSISPVIVKCEPFTNNVPGTSTFECFAIPAFRMCFIRAHIDGAKGAHGSGTSWTVGTISDDEYKPKNNYDLYGSASNNAVISVFVWSDGQFVVKNQGLTSEGTSFSFSGFWSY